MSSDGVTAEGWEVTSAHRTEKKSMMVGQVTGNSDLLDRFNDENAPHEPSTRRRNCHTHSLIRCQVRGPVPMSP